jgi:hypothetical protein
MMTLRPPFLGLPLLGILLLGLLLMGIPLLGLLLMGIPLLGLLLMGIPLLGLPLLSRARFRGQPRIQRLCRPKNLWRTVRTRRRSQ